MMWYGVVWYGVVWYGVVMCAVVWCVVWCDVVWYGVVLYMVWCGMVWYMVCYWLSAQSRPPFCRWLQGWSSGLGLVGWMLQALLAGHWHRQSR